MRKFMFFISIPLYIIDWYLYIMYDVRSFWIYLALILYTIYFIFETPIIFEEHE